MKPTPKRTGSELGWTDKVLEDRVGEHAGTWAKAVLPETQSCRGGDHVSWEAGAPALGWRVIGVKTGGGLSGKREISQTGAGDGPASQWLSQNLENPLGFTNAGNSPRSNFVRSFQNYW